MFHINDLNDMDDSQIRETAESMGVKKASSLSRDEIMNQILDLQAEATAKDFVSKKSEKKKSPKEKDSSKKNKKNQSNDSFKGESDSANSSEQNGADTAASDLIMPFPLPLPKRRGRRPKTEIDLSET